MSTEIKLVDSGSCHGQYDLDCKWAIVDHPDCGRVYLTQEFGGLDTLAGGLYRWRHGLAVQLLPGDTIESLSQPHNEHLTILAAACEGYRDDRPLLQWSGGKITRIAEACGL